MAQAGFILQGAQGKLANIVARKKVGGGTVLAEYKRTITNPNTAAQQGVRSSFKLVSQLASQLADFIAIPREGAKSSRNLFTSINYPNVYANEAGAGIVLENVQITKSNIALPKVIITSRSISESDEIEIELAESVYGRVDKVVYVILKNNNGSLTLLKSETVDIKASNKTALVDWIGPSEGYWYGDLVVYAYGIKLETEAARTKYANMNISTADEVAQVIINRTFSSSEASVTQTSGIEISEQQTESGNTSSNKNRVTINKGGLKGSVSGAGYYAAGATVTLQFTPADSTQHFTQFRVLYDGVFQQNLSTNPATLTMPSNDVEIEIVGYTTNA